METTGIFASLRKTYAGISSQMKRLEVISENIANADALPDKGGKLYQRKVALNTENGRKGNHFGDKLALSLRQSNDKHIAVGSRGEPLGQGSTTMHNQVKVVEVEGEKVIHDPSHPRADENGYVRMPNVNVIEEMVDLMATNRAYEANITVMNSTKTMAKRAFEI